MKNLNIVEEVQQFNGTKKAHDFDFTNSMAAADTGLVASPTVTVKPTGTGVDVTGVSSSGLIAQVTVDANGLGAGFENVELLVEVRAVGDVSGLSDILKKRITFVGKIK